MAAIDRTIALITGANKGIGLESADPGFTTTDMNDHRGHQTVEEGAREPVRLALLPADGPSGGFFDMNGSEPW